MILNLITDGLFALISFIFGLFTIPAMPLQVVNAISNVLPYFAVPIGVLRNYLGDTFFSAILIIIISYVLISPIIHIGFWLYQRIKG